MKPTKHYKQSTQVRNIIAILNLATPEEINNGIHWYFNANKYARELSFKYNVPVFTAAGIIAALSPGISWETNKKDANEFLRRYTTKQTLPKGKFSTYYNNVRKAIKIMGAEKANDVAKILLGVKGYKTMNFYLNILNPLDGESVTVDRHAHKLANKGLEGGGVAITPKQYRETKAAYIEAGVTLMLLPSYVQAITWEVYRRLVGVAKQNESNEGIPF